jgi:molecular chaperone GrpE (heat shock protein)
VYLRISVVVEIMEMEPISQPETETESESESESEMEGVPDLKEWILAKSQLQELNQRRKELMEVLKRKADEVEDYLRTSDRKRLRIGEVQCEIKSSKHVPWNEKTIREHVDEDGKLDVDIFKSQMTTIKDRLVMK